MNISIDLPDAIAHSMRMDGPEAGQRALEIVVLEGYREGAISRGQISELLGLSFWETETLLDGYDCASDLTLEKYNQSIKQAKAFLRQ